MTDKPAAVKATFSDFKLIRTRQIVQIVLEIPLEEADTALATLGGLPRPDKEAWVALARLNGASAINESLPPDETFEIIQHPQPKKNITYGELASKEKRKWDDLDYCTQAGMRCNETRFWMFLSQELGHNVPSFPDHAAKIVRTICGVESRSELNDNSIAARMWNDLDRSYQAWLRV